MDWPNREVYFVGWTHLLDVSAQNSVPVDKLSSKTLHKTALDVLLKLVYFSMRKYPQDEAGGAHKIKCVKNNPRTTSFSLKDTDRSAG